MDDFAGLISLQDGDADGGDVDGDGSLDCADVGSCKNSNFKKKI